MFTSLFNGFSMYVQSKENSFHAESLTVRLHCPFENCEKFYRNQKSLNEHFRLYPAHKPDSLAVRKRISAKQCATKFLEDKTNPYSRKKRVRELINLLNEEELLEFALPRIVNIVSPVNFLLEGTSGGNDVWKKVGNLRDELCTRFPELSAMFTLGPSVETATDERHKSSVTQALKDKPQQVCDLVLQAEGGTIFRDCLMPKVFKQEHETFKEFSCGIVGSFGIAQKEAQDVLRNKWGKKLEKVIGINPILSKNKNFSDLNDTRSELLKLIGLKFNKFGEVVVAHVDIEKYITLFLSQTGTQNAITTPNNCLILMDYTDGFPWLKWSRHFTGETSVRIKLIEPYNLLSTVLTVALWLGGDDYETVRECTASVYKQLKELKLIKHPVSGEEIKIVRRSCGDGKERRSSTGSSSAKSCYPIPEAPEHHTQLGDMKLICPQPVWTVEDTEIMENKFESTLAGKPPSKEKRRQFAAQNLGNPGRKNLTGTPLAEYFPGTAHLGFRAAETICLRIAKIASGIVS